MQLLLPERKAADAICSVQVADDDSSRSIAPEGTVQQVSLIFSCCVPDLQAGEHLTFRQDKDTCNHAHCYCHRYSCASVETDINDII